jgi:hypothetical protein
VETFNPDPDARYHRSLLDAFPVRGGQQLLLLQMEPASLVQRLSALGRRLLGRLGH